MAELLQRQWDLPVLRVALDTASREPAARCTLAAHERGERIVLGERAWPLHELGFPSGDLAGDQRLAVPGSLGEWVAGAMGTGGPLEGIGVLWVHLVKPYGSLGAVPWEAALVPATGRPVLRLPDVLPAPQSASGTLEVALCASGAEAEGQSPAVRHLPAVARAIAIAAGGRRLALHVFADRVAKGVVADVADRLPGVVVVDHVSRGWSDRRSQLRSARTTSTSGSRELGNPWLVAMRDALHGRGIDVVHFVCHGYHTGREGALLFAADPTGSRGDWPSSATATELDALLTELGALDAVFTAPAENYSEAGLLELADRLGVDRPGTTLVHDAARDPEGHALAEGYRLMLAERPRVPPASPALSMIVQPRKVAERGEQDVPGAPETTLAPPLSAPPSPPKSGRRTRGGHRGRGREPISPPPMGGGGPAGGYSAGPSTKAVFESAQSVPGWLASAERFIEQQGAELERYRRRAERKATTAEEAAYYDGVERALARIRGIVDAHAGSSAPPPEPVP